MKRFTTILSAAVLGFWWLWRSRSRNSYPQVELPGDGKLLRDRALEKSAALLQSHAPLRAMDLYLDSFHFQADDQGRQVEAHHYCSRLNDDFAQCVIFDGNTRQAHLIGIEYVISERLFEALPENEKRLWHSHAYEIKSGMAMAPGVPAALESRMMEQMARTYGKVWHTWDSQRDSLPLGIPALMMSFTDDDQIQPGLLPERDSRMGVSTERRRSMRTGLPAAPPLPGADAWQDGRTPQLEVGEKEVQPLVAFSEELT